MTIRMEITGRKFGSLTVLAFSHAAGVNSRTFWRCLCDCGAELTVQGIDLTAGKRRSCGCGRRGANHRSFKHGMTGTCAHSCWLHAIDRCFNPSSEYYSSYGGRGVTMCARWKESFEAFLSDMGEPPSPKHSIDRLDVNGDYEPHNCRWATMVQQNRNKRNNRMVEIDGAMLCLADAAEKLGLTYTAARKRANRGTLPTTSEPTIPQRQKVTTP